MYIVTLKNKEKYFATCSKKNLEKYILENISNIYYVKKDNIYLSLDQLEKELEINLFLANFDKNKRLAESIEDNNKTSK